MKNKLTNYFFKSYNKIAPTKCCYICKNKFKSFKRYRGGTNNMSDYMRMLEIVGSDVDNFGCYYCGSHDRERHLFMFFDKMNIWSIMNGSRILHFAPEKHLSIKIAETNHQEYILADFHPKNSSEKEIDATSIDFPSNYFDIIICNHVLEHIPNYVKAVNEIFRVLKNNGVAILQTPYSKLLKNHFFDENINTDELREFFYGEIEHYIIFAKDQLFNDLQRAGFTLNIVSNASCFDEKISDYYGINKNEDLILVKKLYH